MPSLSSTEVHLDAYPFYVRCGLKQLRYSWRHDSVLFTLEPALRKHIEAHNESKKTVVSKKLIIFVKPSERKKVSKSSSPAHLFSGLMIGSA